MRALPDPMSMLLCAVLGAATCDARSAALPVTVTDDAGKPLADAVVTLEPAGAPLPVKPMPAVEISQSKREFHPFLTVITVGTAVRHQAYSFSPIKPFELKLYAGVPNMPAGTYRLRARHAGLAVGQDPASQPFIMASTEMSTTLKIAMVTP